MRLLTCKSIHKIGPLLWIFYFNWFLFFWKKKSSINIIIHLLDFQSLQQIDVPVVRDKMPNWSLEFQNPGDGHKLFHPGNVS